MSDQFPISFASENKMEPEVRARTSGLRVSTITKTMPNMQSAEDSKFHDIVVAEIRNMDKDGNGTIDSNELYKGVAIACDRAVKAEEKAGNYKKIAIALCAFTILLILANFATSFFAYSLGKDLKLKDGSLSNMKGDAVGINQNMIEIPLAATPWMDIDVIQKIENVGFSVTNVDGEDEDMFFKVASVKVVEQKSVKITTVSNDKITWSVEDDAISLVTNDGDTHENENILCATCGSISVVVTDDLIDRMAEFYTFVGENESGSNGRRLLLDCKRCGARPPKLPGRRLVTDRSRFICPCSEIKSRRLFMTDRSDGRALLKSALAPLVCRV